MKNISIIILAAMMLALSACTIDEQLDPNGPSINSLLAGAETGELDLLVYGAEARMRVGWGTYITSVGSIAREMYRFDADPRNTEDLLGKGGRQLDNNTFYLTAPYGSRFQTVKNCNILLQAADATSLATEAQKNGYRGFAKTIKALMFLQELARLHDNGIRVDVSDPDKLGPFVSRAAGYAEILKLLDEGYSHLQSAEFTFKLSSGFNGFDDPAGFARFNRAVAARAATYAEDYDKALAYLNDSFLDIDGDLFVGPKHVFSTASGDILNPVFTVPGQSGEQNVVHDSHIADILPGDTRISKFRLRANPTSQDDLNGTHESAIYASAFSPIDIIRNEELILVFAEASIQKAKYGDAVTAINRLRTHYGLDTYSGGENETELIEEMLYHRRYSFWGEGHRMFDLRRYGRLNAQYLPIDRPGDLVFTQFPRPLTEN